MHYRIKWNMIFRRGQHPVLGNCLFWTGLQFFPKFFHLPRFTAYKRDVATYVDRKEYDRIMRVLHAQLRREPQRLLARLNARRRFPEPLFRVSRRVAPIAWDKRTPKEQLRACRTFLAALGKSLAYVYYPLWVEEVIRSVLRPVFERRFGCEWEMRYFEATRPQQETTAERFRRALLRAARSYVEKKLTSCALERVAKRLVMQFGYLRVYLFRVSPYTPSDLVKEIVLLARNNPEREWRRQVSLRNEQEQKRRAVLERCSARERLLLTIVSASGYLRDERIGWWGRAVNQAKPLLDATARTLGLSYDEFMQLTTDELRKRRWRKAELHRRARGYRFLVRDGHIAVTSVVVEPQKEDGRARQRVLHGLSVSQGKAKGVVQFADAYSFPLLRRGVILVAAMTTPDAVPYLRRVRAIVTDEGGATTHAAIIARELGIPCIVGTKVATQVFKDGDRVEVDAEHGIVKKI